MLLLYTMDGCPYCKKVMDHLEEKGITYRNLNIADPVNLDELLLLGGEKQVPFLVDTDKNVKMYESGDIIEYLDAL